MLTRTRRFATLVLAWFSLVAALPAAETDPARLVPETAVGYLAINQPDVVLDAALNPLLFEKLQAVEGVQKYLGSKDYRQLKDVVAVVEGRLGLKWDQGLRDLLGGIYLAHDPQTKANILMVRAKKAETLQKLHDTVRTLLDDDAAGKDKKSPVESKDYKGQTGWTFGGDEYHTILDGNLLVVCNKADGLKAVVDQALDPAAKGLAGVADFEAARKANEPGALAWGMLNLNALRMLPKVEKALTGKADNPLVELLAGGIQDAAAKAPTVSASLRVDPQSSGSYRLELNVQLTRDAAKVADTRKWYFGPETAQEAPRALQPKNTIGNIAFYRDLSAFWEAREELFSEKVNAGFTQADTNLGLFFSGRDFGPEVLGELGQRWQLIFARQQFATDQPAPAVKLPAMALVAELKTDDFAQTLLLAFQNAVSIANLTGLQSGRAQLMLGSEERGGATITKSSYMAVSKAQKENAGPEFNFSPACVRVGKHFVIASTTDLARELVDLLKDAKATAPGEENTLVEIDGRTLLAAFEDNRERITSQRMLSQGKSREEAEKLIDQLYDLGRLLTGAKLQLVPTPNSLKLGVSVDLQPLK
jgi:hypothetical protein